MSDQSKSMRKRIFETGILLMMAMMAVVTVAFSAMAEEGDDNSSYSLIIKKAFDFKKENIPEDVQTQALDQTYTFKITGTRIDNGETVPVEETFQLPRIVDGQKVWESERYKSSGPFNVTVTELTDNVDITDSAGNHYNMSDSSSDTDVKIDSRKHEVQLKNNCSLTVSRLHNSGGPERLWYRITSRPYDEHPSGNFEALDMTFSLVDGESRRIAVLPSGHPLCAAIYTIEQIAAPYGYQLQLGTRTETVTDGNKGHFHINGTPGRLTLTAGGTAGDGQTHLFTIERTETEAEDDSEFTTRSVRMASGETYVFDNLPKGGYTVTEYSYTKDVNTRYSVVMPQTTEKKQSGYSSAPSYYEESYFRTFALSEGTVWFQLQSFGPLLNSNKKALTSSNITYGLQYGWGNDQGGITYSTVSGTYKANLYYTMNSAAKRYPDPDNLVIGFRTPNLSSETAKYMEVTWLEHIEKDVTKNLSSAGVQYTSGITVDDRGWMTINAPEPEEGVDTSHIVYYYTLRNSKKELIAGSEVGGETDKPDTTTVMLRAGESVTLNGLAKGSYRITETVDWDFAGFTMQVEGYPFGTTEAGKSIKVDVGGQRDLTISKPAVSNLPAGAADEREYTFNVSGSGFYQTVDVKAGESVTVTLPQEGIYSVSAQADTLPVYGLKYTESGVVYGTASGSTSDITFTNVFSRGEYGYRYVHEYYVKDADGTYTFEGNSQITTRLGREEQETYQAFDISKVPEYNSTRYMHFDEAYGWVDPIAPSDADQTDSDKKATKDVDGDEGEEPSEEDDMDITGDEESDASDENNGDHGDATGGEETESPDKDNGDDGNHGDTTGGEETESPDKDNGDHGDTAGGEETESPDQDNTNTTGDEGTEVSGEDASSHINSTAAEAFSKAALNTPGGGAAETDDAGTEDSSDGNGSSAGTDDAGIEDSSDGNGSGAETDDAGTEDSSDGSGSGAETDGEGTEDSSDGNGSGAGTDDAGTEDSSDGSGSDAETDGEGTEDSSDGNGNSAETPDGDDLDSSGGDSTEAPDEDPLDPSDISKVLSAASYDSSGIIDTGVAKDSSGADLNYGPDDDKDHIVVTKEASQIVILRYYRERYPEGKYNVIHVYYRRDENGDHWEGTSGVRPQTGELGIKYSGKQVERENSFQPADADQAYEYTWDGRPQYGVVENNGNTGSFDPDTGSFEFAGDGLVYRPNNEWTSVEGTEEGNQIIILRYYREPKREGYYNVVHEYYTRKAGETTGYGLGRAVGPMNADSETGEGEEDGADGFSGTLSRNDGYIYTFEGYVSMPLLVGPLGATYTEATVGHELKYEGNDYTYIDAGYGAINSQNYSCDPNQQWAVSTVEGDELIILRYYREIEDPPSGGDDEENKDDEKEEEEDKKGGKNDHEESVPVKTPEESGSSSEDPVHFVKLVNPETPDNAEKIESPNSVPETGDDNRTALWIILVIGSLCGLIAPGVRRFFDRKRTK